MALPSSTPASADDSGELVLLAERGDVLEITLNRPGRRNAIDLAMARRMGELAAGVAATRAKVILLRAIGPAFTVGGDVAHMGGAPDDIGPILDGFHAFARALAQGRAAVVASVHGAVAGGGLGLMLNADVILAAETAKFNLAYRQLGTSPDGGCTYYLPRLVGPRRAFALLMMGEPMTAQQALANGLVTEVVPDETLQVRTEAVVAQLCANASESAAQIRQLLQASSTRSLAAQLDAERAAFLACSGTEEFREGVRAFMEKRAPRFQAVE